jgi:hypothetical protein
MIADIVKRLKSEIPDYVTIIAATKTRSQEEIVQVIETGILDFGENYVQEAQRKYASLEFAVRWHCIGHLQTNKVKKAVEIFDVIQTVDSLKLAAEIDRRCSAIGKKMPVLIEINSAREEDKSGVFPENTIELVETVAALEHLSIIGLMTMGPVTDRTDEIRPYLRLTRKLFEEISNLGIENVSMKYLSMGMSDSYRVAIEEGSNMVRLGTAIFGERK